LRTFVSPGVALLALALGLSGCSDSTSKTLILEPQTGAYALRGHVRLIGRLAESSNPVSPESTGVRTVDNATGVRVFIKRPGGAVDSTVTVDGVYEFRFDEPGSYRVFAWVVAPDTVATAQVATAARDTTIAAVFELGPHGDVDTYPNPFPSTGADAGVGVELTPASDETIEVRILNIAGAPVYSYSRDWLTGILFHLHWVGVNDANVEVPNGAYWATARADGVTRYNLVFKE
jgi:hypothetical protein